MKKVLCFALILLLFALSACGKAELPEVQPETKATEEQTESTQDAEAASNIEEQAPIRAEFNFETRTVMLNSGYDMPINGIGTYSLHDDECVNAVKTALSNGVRLIDTASAYGNEEEVGQAIREAIEEGIIQREDVFVITKLYPGSEMENPEQSIQACLDRLNIGYVDMMLLHHPYYQENDVIPFIQDLGIVVQGWYPLGGRGHTAELLGDEAISEIAEEHGVSSAQVILRWNLQKGVVVIPGSSNPEHIKENTELYHFSLTDEEMAQINGLDRGEKHDWY